MPVPRGHVDRRSREARVAWVKRVMLGAVCAATLALTACGAPPTQTQTDPVPAQDPASTDPASSTPTEDATTVAPSEPAVSVLPPGSKTYHATQKTADGYQQSMTLTVYPAIPGRDLPVLNAAWTGVGGTGDVPCLDAAGLNMTTGVSIPTQTSVYAVGTLAIENETPDFGGGDITWDFAGSPANNFAMGFGYSNGAECDSLWSGTLTRPKWTGPSWGPVPIVIAYGNVVNPNHPEGDYAKIATEPFGLPLGGNPITADGKAIDGIVVTAADPTWLQQARAQG